MMNEQEKALFKKYNLTEFSLSLLIASKDNNFPRIIQNLTKLGYLDNKGFLTEKGKSIIEEYTKTSFSYTEEDMKKLTETIRGMYPTGIKPGSNKSWRGTEKEVLSKLYSVMKQHTDITIEEVTEAVKKYLNTGESSYRRTLPYFIEKFGESDMYTYIITMRESKKESPNLPFLTETEEDDGGRWL